MSTTVQSRTMPGFNAYTLMTIITAGALATVAFDTFGQFISPLLKSVAAPFLGAKLAPIPLAQQVLAKLSGIPGKELGALGIPHGMHALTGVILYPLGYMLIVRPLHRMVAPQLPWVLPAIAYGIGLFVFALYFMAHLIAGNPPFLGWGSITWVALWGHIVFGVITAWVIEAREPRV